MVRFYRFIFALTRGKRYFAVPSPICDAHNLRIFEEDNARNIHYGKLQAILLFAVGLLLLIKAGDWFVDGAAGLARRFHIPDILIGATVVSIGTTLPEVMVSATSAVSGHGELAYGNAIGSIICNTALIAAITIAVKPGQVDRGTMKTPVRFYFIAAAFYAATAYLKGHFTRTDGILLLLIFVAYMSVAIVQAIRDQQLQEKLSEGADPHDVIEDELESTFNPLWKDLLLLVVGAALIAVGANLLVDNGTILARMLGVPESVIALTFIALGTSLPELVTAVTSLFKGHGALSLGNIIGANMFNLVLVSGLSITLNPFDLPTEKLLAGHNASLVVDVPLTFIVMLLLTLPGLVKGRLYRWQGILLLAIYAVFCTFQFLL